MELRTLKDKASEAFTKGRFSKAAEFYEEYCLGDPKDLQARLRMGDAWAKAGQRTKAIHAYQGAAESFAREGFLPRAIAASKLILELDPTHRGVQQMLADLYARRGTPMPGQGRGTRPARPAATETPEPATPAQPPPPPAQAQEDAAPEVVTGKLISLEPGAPIDLSDELPAELALPKTPAPAPTATPPAPEVSDEISFADVSEEVLGPKSPAKPAAATPAVSAPPAPASASGASASASTQTPAPVTAPTPVPAAPQSPPAAPVTAPAVSAASEPRAPEPAKSTPSTLPPGLSPRSTAKPSAAPSPAPATPEAAPVPDASPKRVPWVAASSLLTSSPSVTAVAPNSSAPPGLRPRRSGEGEPAPSTPTIALPFRELAPEDTQVALASISVSSFTELELEADTLLQAVEAAALEGMRQRAGTPATEATSGEGEEETVFSLTEEFVENAPSLDALPNIPLFSDLPRDAFIELFERCPLRRFTQGERILEQGTQGDAFYVICEGKVRVFREDGGEEKQLAVLESGTFFGEMALLSEAPRTASVEGAAEDTQLLEISAAVLADLSGRYPQVAKALKKFCRERLLSNVMNSSPLFRVLGRKDRRELIERFRARDVRRGDNLIRDGEQTDGLYVVLTGEVEVHKQNQLLTRLKEGDLFGEISLLQKTPATATVTASRRTTILRLPREDFDRLIMSYPQILALVSELTDERLRRTEELLSHVPAPEPEYDEDLILV